jgi:serine/threonine-protein kinase
MADLREELNAVLTDRYAIERELGRGGMAFVFLAQDLKHRRPVAIKVLRPDLAAALGAERFLREIEIAARLTHPHILPLHDSGAAGGFLYYVMPYLEGESLRDRLNRETPLPLDDALRITREIADALSYAHRHGVVHRDIKPENILFEAGHAVVSDFGIARAVSAAGGDKLTETGIAVGTPAYMSPEQAAGTAPLDGRSDLYSLACVAYEMLAGQPPFTGPSARVILARHVLDPVPPLRTARSTVSGAIEQAITRALGKLPQDRFVTAAQFAEALAGAAGAAPRPRVERAVWPPRARTAARIVVGVVLVLGLTWAIATRFSGPAVPVSSTRVAVLPFSVLGSPSVGYLAEGLVDLLSRNLDGAENLRTIDAATVVTAARDGDPGAPDAERARAIARRVGAGLYVLGSVNAVGGRLRIYAQLYDQPGGTEAAVQAAVEGDTAQLFELVDRLSADLLVGRQRGPAFRLTQTAAATTSSLAALKAYLGAERDLRAGKVDSAIAGFQRAIAEDSAFALAYYRLAVSAGWRNRTGTADAATAWALALGSRLTARDRRLLAAYAAVRSGAVEDAERHYRAILADYPDELEAEFQLADLLYHYNPLRGRPRREAREPFDRRLALDPGFL